MTMFNNNGAVSTAKNWQSTNRKQAHCEVIKLQVRIAKLRQLPGRLHNIFYSFFFCLKF